MHHAPFTNQPHELIATNYSKTIHKPQCKQNAPPSRLIALNTRSICPLRQHMIIGTRTNGANGIYERVELSSTILHIYGSVI